MTGLKRQLGRIDALAIALGSVISGMTDGYAVDLDERIRQHARS